MVDLVAFKKAVCLCVGLHYEWHPHSCVHVHVHERE